MTRPPPKLLRQASLLLCLAAAAVWSLAHLQPQQFIFTAGKRLVWVHCSGEAVDATTVAPWPRARPFRWIRGRPDDATDRMPLVGGPFAGRLTPWQRWGVSGVYGPVKTMLDLGGDPASVTDWSLHGSGRGKPLRPSATMAYHSLRIPMWMPVAATAAYPLASFAAGAARRRQRRRRAGRGLCVHCGYDLQGNTTGVCPECGGAIAEAR